MTARRLFITLLSAICTIPLAGQGVAALPQDYTASWVGTDALGRHMPTSDEVGLPKTDKDRVVGIFYITWHGPRAHKDNMEPGEYWHDVTKVLETSPRHGTEAAHTIGENPRSDISSATTNG